MGDSSAFVVPYMVKDLDFDNALDDIGASVSIMPSFVFDRLLFPPLTPAHLTVYLADGSIQYPKGIAKDVLVRVRDFIIPLDFVVLNVSSDDLDVLLIFGRPFLATCRDIIDVGTSKLTLRIDGEDAKFEMAKVKNVGGIGAKSKAKAKAKTKSS